MIEVLLHFGADPRISSANRMGRTPLDEARSARNTELIFRLQAAIKELNARPRPLR